jgi:hypothetical protein
MWFRPFIYESKFESGLGRAWLHMTANPGYVMISSDQNDCLDDGSCFTVGYRDDFSSVLYLMTKVSEAGSIATYEASPVPFTELGRKLSNPSFERALQALKITVEADLSKENSVSEYSMGEVFVRQPKTLKVKFVSKNGAERVYKLVLATQGY